MDIRRSLSNVFLDLIVDRDLEVAYTRQADTEDLDTPKLLRNVKLTFADSILLLNLRQRLSDLHDVPIALEGFLFVGNSGSGKSTLLDAFSALLIPPRWLDFNAAARESEPGSRDRNLMSYVRGAWSEQEDVESGEIKTRYLRGDTTWSSIFRGSRSRTSRHEVDLIVF